MVLLVLLALLALPALPSYWCYRCYRALKQEMHIYAKREEATHEKISSTFSEK